MDRCGQPPNGLELRVDGVAIGPKTPTWIVTLTPQCSVCTHT
jgi:hypothetical protein